MRNLVKAAVMAGVMVAVVGLVVVPAGAGRYGKQKVIYHFNSADFRTIAKGLRNIQNHINAVGKHKLTVAAVVHAGAWVMLAKGRCPAVIVARLKSLVKQGVKFYFCANTMRKHKLSPKALVIPCTVVPSGVAEITRLEQMGYAYIKP